MHSYKRALLAVWACLFILAGLLCLVASQADAHQRKPAPIRRCHGKAMTPQGKTFLDEIGVPSAFRTAPVAKALTASGFQSPALQIPGSAPYIGRVREYARINLPYVIIGFGSVNEPTAQTVTFELLRSGMVVFSAPLPDTEILNTGIGKTRKWVGVLTTDFVNPIPIYAGQSLEWRFSGTFKPIAEEAGEVAVIVAFNAQGSTSGSISYTEGPL